MTPLSILIAEIILESIKLTRVILEGIPIEERQKAVREHNARMDKLQEFFERLTEGQGSST